MSVIWPKNPLLKITVNFQASLAGGYHFKKSHSQAGERKASGSGKEKRVALRQAGLALPPSAHVLLIGSHSFFAASCVITCVQVAQLSSLGDLGLLPLNESFHWIMISSLPDWYWTHLVEPWQLGLRKFCDELLSGNSGSKDSWVNNCHPQLYTYIHIHECA